MNLQLPHTVIVISAKRIRLDWLKPARILGPGIYHYQGDLRPRLRTLSQTKSVSRGFVEVRFEAGDTVAVLKRLLVEAAQDPGTDDAAVAAQNARLEFIFGLAGLAGVNLEGNLTQPVVANLEGTAAPAGTEITGVPDGGAHGALVDGVIPVPEGTVDTGTPDDGTHADLVEDVIAAGQVPLAKEVAAAQEAGATASAPAGDNEEFVIQDADVETPAP